MAVTKKRYRVRPPGRPTTWQLLLLMLAVAAFVALLFAAAAQGRL